MREHWHVLVNLTRYVSQMLLTVPQLKFNADGTSFQTGGGLSELVKVGYLPEDFESKGASLKVAAQKGQSLVCFIIKVYIFIKFGACNFYPC